MYIYIYISKYILDSIKRYFSDWKIWSHKQSHLFRGLKG